MLSDLRTYRTTSRKWRDLICIAFLGRTSTSSARYQDDLFNDNATSPIVLDILGKENRDKQGIVEAYIYRKFAQRFSQMSTGLKYCIDRDRSNFELTEFLALFWNEPGLRRSIDKIYEIVVYSLFSALTEALEVSIEVSICVLRSDCDCLQRYRTKNHRFVTKSNWLEIKDSKYCHRERFSRMV